MSYESSAAEVSLLRPIVIDNGTGQLKCGFAGEDRPGSVFPSFVGRPKHHKVMTSTKAEGDTFVGSEAEALRGILRVSYPMSHGVVDNWEDMEKIWHSVFHSALKVPSDQHPVLLTEAPLNPRRNREKAAEVFFEAFNTPALFVSMQAVLSLYASGRTTGVVLDSGDGVTHAVPIYEGYSLRHSITRVDIAGRDVTDRFQLLLRRSGHNFATSAEREIVRAIKEKMCYVVYNPSREIEKKNAAATPAEYKLPDGSVIQVGSERFKAPEVLFQPSLIGSEYMGVHEALVASITKSDLDLRKHLFEQIVLSGGSTMFAGFGDRLLTEVRKLAPKDIKIRITAPPERQLTTWIGGSILASLSTFSKMWITAAQYREEGADAIHMNTF